MVLLSSMLSLKNSRVNLGQWLMTTALIFRPHVQIFTLPSFFFAEHWFWKKENNFPGVFQVSFAWWVFIKIFLGGQYFQYLVPAEIFSANSLKKPLNPWFQFRSTGFKWLCFYKCRCCRCWRNDTQAHNVDSQSTPPTVNTIDNADRTTSDSPPNAADLAQRCSEPTRVPGGQP